MFKLLTGAACALALAFPLAAQAALVELTATGIGSFGLDQTGVLGAPGLFADRPLSITVTYDTALVSGADGMFSIDAEGFEAQLFGDGGIFGLARQPRLKPLASIELIEDGANDRFNLIYQVAGLDGFIDYAQSLSFSLTGDLFTSVSALPLFDGPLAATGAGEFSIDDIVCLSSACATLRRADGGFTFTAVSAELDLQTTDVPEPSAWTLMITGFGLAGGMLRRRSVRLDRRIS